MKKGAEMVLGTIVDDLEEFITKIQAIRNMEEEAFDGHSHSWQESDRGEAMYARISSLDNAADSLEQAMDMLREVIEEC